MKKWEYYEESDLSIRQLNELGLQGWELISCYVSKNNYFYYIFKREINE